MKNNCNDELSYKIINKLMENFTILESDMELQLKVKYSIDEVIYDYQILPTTKELIVSDMKDKIAYFLACKKLKGLSNITLREYDRLLQSFSSFINKPVNLINVVDIRRYLMFLKDKNNGADTINNKIIIINSFFQFLQDEAIIIANPCANIPKVKAPKRVRKALSIEHQEILRKSCIKPREKAIFEFFISSGIRVSEGLSLKIDDIDWNNRSFYVIGKGDKERRVKFSTRAKIELLDYLKKRKGNSEYLFISTKFPYNKVTVRCIQDEFKRILKRSGLDINVFPHLMRHNFATNSADKGMSLSTLQNLLGHSNPSTTQKYITNNINNIDREYDRIAD